VNRSMFRLFSKVAAVSIMLALLSGCATTKMEGIAKAKSHISSMEQIVDDIDLNRVNLTEYEGVAFLSLLKIGCSGIAGLGWSGTVYVRDPKTKKFGPPSFVSAGGFQPVLIYAGVNVVDGMLLFKSRDSALAFAERSVICNLSFEATFVVWGKKRIRIPGAVCCTDAAGLAVGCLAGELLFCGSKDELHESMYNETSMVKILGGKVQTPSELKPDIDKLNEFMERPYTGAKSKPSAKWD